MEVELISWTHNPIKTIAQAAATCYDSKPNVKVVKQCIASGHHSVLEHASFTFKIEGISRACYDRQTEVLTKEGWKFFSDVESYDEVLTINQKTLKAEFQPILNKISYKYKGLMHEYKSQNIDLLVTPNHNMFMKKYDVKVADNFHLVPSETIKNKRFYFLKQMDYNPEITDNIIIPGYSYNRKVKNNKYYLKTLSDIIINRKNFYKLLAWYLSEGSVYYNEKENSYSIAISQLKENNINHIIQIIEDCGFNCCYDGRTIRFKNLVIGRYFKNLGLSVDKKIPFNIFTNFNQELAKIFLEEYIRGDGTIDKNGCMKIYTISKEMAEQLYNLCYIAGYTASYHIDNRVGQNRYFNGRKIKNNYPCYVINISSTGKRNYMPVIKKDKHFNEVPFNDFVYCVEVPNHTLFVRRNGKACWCGNCSHQLVRHRIASYSQQSQRYVDLKNLDISEDFIYPDNTSTRALVEYNIAFSNALDSYMALRQIGEAKEDARSVLPNACPTTICVTMNLRSLAHFMNERLCCFDDQTEVLTQKGWKFFKDCSFDDLFYSLNIQTGECQLSKAKEFISYPVNEDMILLEGQSINQKITKEHNLVISTSYTKNGNKKWQLLPAEIACSKKRISVKKNCNPIEGDKPEFFIIPETFTEQHNQYDEWKKIYPERKVPIKEFLQFLGFYLSDGSCSMSGNHYNISLSKEKKILEKYKEICKKITPNAVRIEENKGNCQKLVFHDINLFNYLKQFGKAPEKYIPEKCWELDYSLLEYLYKGFSDGDMKKDGTTYSTTSKKLANDFQRLLLHLGWSGTISIIDRVGQNGGKVLDRQGKIRTIVNRNPEYRISINKTKNEPIMISTNRNNFSLEKYQGQVYCVDLEKNHTLYVRRKGKTSWSGNCRAQAEIRTMARLMKQAVKDKQTEMQVTDEEMDMIQSIFVPKCEAGKIKFCPEHDSCGRQMTAKEINKLIAENLNGGKE